MHLIYFIDLYVWFENSLSVISTFSDWQERRSKHVKNNGLLK